MERRRQLEVRRTRTFVVGAVALSVAVVVAWFPASALMSDHKALATVTTQLDTLRRQDHALAQEQARLGQSAEIERLARQQYQMTSPGAQEYQVLPNSSAGAKGSSDPYSSDPGLQRPVAPSGTAQLPPGTLTDGVGGPGATSGSTGSGGPHAAGKGQGLLERIVHTLEFWR
ncbi:MAG: septum formation initiator family protein [Acidimicrobiales bacterium]